MNKGTGGEKEGQEEKKEERRKKDRRRRRRTGDDIKYGTLCGRLGCDVTIQ